MGHELEAYEFLQSSLLATVISASCRVGLSGPPPLTLPHPVKVATSPAYFLAVVQGDQGRQIGDIVRVIVMSELRVIMEMSLT